MGIEDTIGVNLPDVGLGGAVGVVTAIIVLLITLVVLGVLGYLVMNAVKFNKKIVIFEKINGRFEPSKKDRATLVRFGTGGDQLFYLKKLKKYVPIPEFQTGRNTYWFFLRKDGELINFSPGDFDEQSRLMGAKFLDKEMRFARVSLQGHWKERYDKPKFWEKYGALIANIIFIVVILALFFLILDKYLSSIGQLESLLQTTEKLQETNMKVLGAIDNVCSGSGIR